MTVETASEPREASASAQSSPRGVLRLVPRSAASSQREVWRAFWTSRLLVWLVGCATVLLAGTATTNAHMFDPTGISTSLGQVGNVLVAPAVRWDAIWYLHIAGHGYWNLQSTGFYPLLPLLIHGLTLLTGSAVLSGMVISLGCLFLALEVVRRLAELELGPEAARATVLLMAFAPLTVFMSAVYTESLFVALSAGTFLAARTGRWPLAAGLGALAAFARVGGVLLVIPLVIMFFYGPRSDALPVREGAWWKPRYGFSPVILLALAIPVAAAAFDGYLALRGFGFDATVHAQEAYWGHTMSGPLSTVWGGIEAAFDQITSGFATSNAYGADALTQVCALAIAIGALVICFRRLPFAYGSYVLIDLVRVLMSPTTGDPLHGLDRYLSMRFPLFMVVAAWAVQRGRLRPLLAVSIGLAIIATMQFASWQEVGALIP